MNWYPYYEGRIREDVDSSLIRKRGYLSNSHNDLCRKLSGTNPKDVLSSSERRILSLFRRIDKIVINKGCIKNPLGVLADKRERAMAELSAY